MKLDNGQYKKIININDNDFVVDFSQDTIISELLRIQEFAKGKTVIECKEEYIKALKIMLGDDCIDKIYGKDEPQAITLQDCVNCIFEQHIEIDFAKQEKQAAPYLEKLDKYSKYKNFNV